MKSGTKTIITGIGLLIIGAVIVPVAIILPIVFSDSGEKQFVVPGKIHYKIEKPGRYYLWNDYQTVFNGTSYNRSRAIPDGLEFIITRADTGKSIGFISNTSTSYTSGSSAKVSIGYIDMEKPGPIEITIQGGTEERVFSVSRSVLFEMLGQILGGFGVAMLISMAGTGMLIWGIIKLANTNKTAGQSETAGVKKH